jgi:stage V sporulation protein S
MPTLRVSAGSRPNAVAGAIAALLRLEGAVEMQAIGPHAVNQAVKSLAIARAYLIQDQLDLVVAPSFVKLELHDEERTAMRFEVQAVPRAATAAGAPASAAADAPDGAASEVDPVGPDEAPGGP